MKLIGPVRREGRYGYITTSGDFAIEPKYEFLDSISEGLIIFLVEHKIGFLNTDGSIKIPARFESAGQTFPFKSGLACVSCNGKQGYIDTEGNWVIQPTWHEGWNFLDQMAIVHGDNGYCVIDKRGGIVTNLNVYEVSYWPDWVKDWNCFRCLFKDGTPDFAHGCVNWRGEIVFAPVHSELTEFYEGIAGFRDGEQAPDERWGLVTFSGDIVREPQFFDLKEFYEGLAAAARDMTPRGKTKGRGYIDVKGNWQIEPIFNCAKPFSDGLACVSKNQPVNRYGFIDRAGELVIPLIYSSPANFIEGYAIVEMGDEVHVINKQGSAIYRGPR